MCVIMAHVTDRSVSV